MIINIRGALGTQIFEYIHGLTVAKSKNQTVEEVHINVSGAIVETAKVDWISSIIEMPYPVRAVESSSKQGVWSNPVNFSNIINSKVIDDLVCKINPIKSDDEILHIRGKDRKIASIDDYVSLMDMIGSDVKLLGDDNILIEEIIRKAGFGKNISKDELTDWSRLMGCKKIYCAFTNYPLSALIFSPDTEINMLSRDHSNGYVTIDEEVYSCVDVFFKEYLKNGRWI
tara:strand:+ start:2954 stop:3634 length:681 start_codon:yes stop_codon:yes gene_type:complete